MKIKNTLLGLAALTAISTAAISTQAHAYAVYNKTNHSVQIKDTAGLAGMNATLAPNTSTSCSPSARGCYGKISFSVYAPQADGREICSWKGKIKKGGGHYFVITSVPGVNYPDYGSCFLEYYRG